MMRVLSALLFLHLSLVSLVSCTSTGTSEDGSDESGAVSGTDDGASDDAAAISSDSDSATSPAKSEDDLEADLDKDETSSAAAEPTKEAQTDVQKEDNLEKDLADQETPAVPDKQQPPPAAAEPAPPPPVAAVEPTPEPAAPPAERAQIRDIRYVANTSGGTVVIETSKPVTFQSRMNPATQQFVVEIADADLPPALQRPYALKEFNSRFGSINAYQSPGSNTARVVIQMSGVGAMEPMVQQEGTSLVVVPPSAPPAPVAGGAAPEPTKNTDVTGDEHKGSALAARTLDEFLTGNQKFYGRNVSLQVKDADIRDVINFIAEESGANIVMSDDVSGKISLKLRKIPWDQALVTVMRSKGLGYVRQGNVLRITTLKTLQFETESSNKLIESQKASVPTVVQVMPISYASTDDILKDVTPFLSKEGKAVIDNRSSTLIVTDKVDVVDRISKLVKTLDVAPAQVSIESKIVEAIEGFENYLGVNWGLGGTAKQLSPGGGAYGQPIWLTPTVSSGSIDPQFQDAQPFKASLNLGTLDVLGNLTAALTLAEQDSLAKVISAPRISTMNREKSTITQQSENVSVTSTKSDVTGAVTKTEKRTPYAIELSVTPQVTSDGQIIMDLDLKREFLGAVVDRELQSQPINTRKAKTKILVRNGQTAVIGGIYTNDETSSTLGVPGLMNIPVLGWLFKTKSVTRTKNELLIFMTPRILASDNGAQAVTQ